jgi:PKD repeat protein
MKKIYLSILLIMIGMALVSQPVDRQKVIVEIGTGTWCTYCPGAAMGADDLVENGCEVGVIEYHNGDPFTNEASNARNSYYAVSGYPTAHFDGVLEYVGGSHTQSMYPNYLPLYQQRIAIPSDFTIEIYGDNTGSLYNIQLVINKVNGSWTTLKAHLVLTESEIVYSWQDQDHLNYVERLMAPDYNGTIVDFTNTSTVTLNLQFTIDAGWVANNCELVAFLQNDNTKECLQGNMVAIPDLQPMQATAGFECDDVTPCITTAVEFEDQSLGDIVTWNWTFEGGNPATSAVQNPVVTYNAQGQYDVQLMIPCLTRNIFWSLPRRCSHKPQPDLLPFARIIPGFNIPPSLCSGQQLIPGQLNLHLPELFPDLTRLLLLPSPPDILEITRSK